MTHGLMKKHLHGKSKFLAFVYRGNVMIFYIIFAVDYSFHSFVS